MRAGKEGVTCHLKALRQARGLSQTQLAELVGVKRQAIYDIESGRYMPNTVVALRLAKHLGCRVEDLFVEETATEDHPITVVEERHGEGCRMVLAKVRGRLVGYPLTGKGLILEGLRAADGVLRDDGKRVRLLCPEAGLDRSIVLLGCDPAFPVLGSLVARRAPEVRVHCRFASSHKALHGLAAGHAHLAGTHLHNSGTGESNVELAHQVLADSGLLVVGFSLLDEGLMVAAGNPHGLRTVADLAKAPLRLVNREPGAALRVLLDDQLDQHGIPRIAVSGYSQEVHSHFEGAQMVAYGFADAALGLRPVAEAYGLDFVPMATVRCDLVVPRDLLDHAGIKVILDILQTRSFREELRSIPGYSASRTGDVIADL